MFEPGAEGRDMNEEQRAAVDEIAGFYNLLFGQGDELDYDADLYEDEDDEGPFESLLRHAPEIEAGLEARPLTGGSAFVDYPVGAAVQVNA
jgi:hypothetical protein